MPREFMPHSEHIMIGGKQFEILESVLDLAEEKGWSEGLISCVLKYWPMPNEPVLSEN